jgi:transposase-like protein
MQGKSHRPGLYLCGSCRGNFSVTVGTVYERSKIPLTKWLLATHLLSSSKKGISAHQIHRMLGITYKSAWFMCHRIREAMKADGNEPPMGGAGEVVEADETYIGRKHGTKKARAFHHKNAVVSLVEREGAVRSFHIDRANIRTISKIVAENVAKESRLHTDESRMYLTVGKDFAAHESVNHGLKEWARGDVTTNSAEGFFSVFKRGMKGVYQHCDERHLHRYLAEFDFRHNNRTKLGVSDADRAEKAVKGIVGKRLTYRRINERATA